MAERKFIPFLQAVREGIIKEGERVDISACLPKTEGVVTLTPDETGWKEKQTFDRNKEMRLKWPYDNRNKEMRLKWTYFKDSNEIASLVSTPTNFKLYLKGRKGYTNGSAVLQRVCWAFANPKIGLSARSLCNEDTENVDKEGERAWLASPYVGTYNDYAYFGLRIVCGGNVGYYDLYSSFGSALCSSGAVRPVVSILTSDILIDLESKDRDGIWELVPPKEV